MTTPTLQDPLTLRTVGAMSLPLRVCETLGVDGMVREAQAYEAEMAKLGSGWPPLSETLHIALMWQAICEFSVEGEH
jgi:hypothetical protein